MIISAIPVKTPTPNINSTGIYDKLKCKVSFIPVIIGIYSAKIKSNVEPEIPGNIIANIAIIPAKNTYIANPKFKLVISIFAPLPVCGLKYVIADTTIIPISVNIKFLYLPFTFYFLSYLLVYLEHL